MTNVSKHPLTKQQETDLFANMSAVFANTPHQKVHALLVDLLGPEERIMLAKRIAIIIMLDRKHSSYFIASTLHVSPATVTRVASALKSGKYDTIAQLFRSKSIRVKDILESIDAILHLGGLLPHYGQTHKSEAYKKRLAKQQQRS